MYLRDTVFQFHLWWGNNILQGMWLLLSFLLQDTPDLSYTDWHLHHLLGNKYLGGTRYQ